MASGQVVIIRSPSSRNTAWNVIRAAPDGSVMSVTAPRRTNDQNAKMHAMLSDIARAKPQGRVLAPDIWKALFMASCGHKVRFEPTLDGEGVVPIGFRSSRMSKAEMSDLIEAIACYAAEHGIELHEKDKS